MSSSSSASDLSEGLNARRAAVAAVRQVFARGSFLEASLQQTAADIDDARDRAFAHALAATMFRHRGQLDQVIDAVLDRSLDRSAAPVRDVLLCGAAQLLFLRTEPHAAISTSVALAGEDTRTVRFKGLVNAVLRRISDNREAILADLPAALTGLPAWLQKRLRADLGPASAEACAAALLTQADLDLTLKNEALRQPLESAGGRSLPTSSVRFAAPYPAIPALAGYAEGGWWVQDTAASLPARLLGDINGMTVLDMCAAPGGKTLQLAAAGARVTAVDISPERLEIIQQNLARTGLEATCIASDALTFESAEQFDAILLDAPCSATGTIRRHPELPWLRKAGDIAEIVKLQRQLLRKAASLLKPGGTLVYAVCSLLAEEGGKQVQAFLNENRNFSRLPIDPESLGLDEQFITRQGDLRTLPHLEFGGHRGMDGFHVARLTKAAD